MSTEKPIDAFDLGMLDEFSPVGGDYSPVHSVDELCLSLQHTANGFSHHLHGGFSLAGRQTNLAGLAHPDQIVLPFSISYLSFKPSGY